MRLNRTNAAQLGRTGLNADGDELHVSAITRAELFAGRGAEERGIRRLLEAMTNFRSTS